MNRVRRHLLAALVALGLTAGVATAAPLVAIDAGHGGADSGAVGVLPAGTVTGLPARTDKDGQTLLYEKDVTLDIAQRLNTFLQGRGFPTVMTRTTDMAGGDVPYTTVGADLKARVDIANAADARMFISIHENSLNATSSGTETYHFYYSSEAAKLLAGLVHEKVVTALGLPDRGVKAAGFYVLKNTEMPAILVEGAFLTNPTDVLMLADANVRQQVAEAIGAGVVAYSDAGYDNLYVKGLDNRPHYQVNVGAFRKLKDARIRLASVKKKGFTAAIRSEFNPVVQKNLFYVVSGKYARLEVALAKRDRLRARGFRANVGPVATTSRPIPATAPH